MFFSPQEQAARRQFHEIFCTKYLYTGEKTDALNDDSWNAEVLSDILHGIYEDNPLTAQDIETILQLCGMYDHNNELYFHLHTGTPLIRPLVTAISPFITTESFVKCQQTLNGRELDSVGEFLTRCCCANIVAYRVPSIELYDAYQAWCKLNKFLAVGRRSFTRRLGTLGYKQRKGYVNKRPGVNFYYMTFDKEAAAQYVKSSRTSEEDEEQEGRQPVWNVVGAGTKITPKPIQEAEGGVPQYEEPRDDNTDDREDDSASWETGERVTSAADDFGDGEAFDDFDWGSPVDDEDEDTSVGYERSETSDRAELRAEHESVQERVNHLPMALRQCFKLSKVTYKIAPDHFDRDEFDRDVKAAAGGPLAINLDEMYELFKAYAEGRKEI